jgi:hypothetical protein
VLKVKLKLFPTARIPLSHKPVFDVVVCSVSSLFTHVTVVPADTIVGCVGPNNEFTITIVQGFGQFTAGAAPPEPELGGAAAAVPLDGKYDATTGDIARRHNKTPTASHRYFVFSLTETVSGALGFDDKTCMQIPVIHLLIYTFLQKKCASYSGASHNS